MREDGSIERGLDPSVSGAATEQSGGSARTETRQRRLAWKWAVAAWWEHMCGGGSGAMWSLWLRYAVLRLVWYLALCGCSVCAEGRMWIVCLIARVCYMICFLSNWRHKWMYGLFWVFVSRLWYATLVSRRVHVHVLVMTEDCARSMQW